MKSLYSSTDNYRPTLTCSICNRAFKRDYNIKKTELAGNHYCTKVCLTQSKKNRFKDSSKRCKSCKELKKRANNFRVLPSGQAYKNCLSCEAGFAEARQYRDKIKAEFGVEVETYRRGLSVENYLKAALKDAKRRAKSCGRDLDLDLEFLLALFKKQGGRCALSNRVLTWYSGKGRHQSFHNISLDRIDSSKGYLKENVQIVCYMVNLMKNRLTKEELLEWSRDMVKHNDTILER